MFMSGKWRQRYETAILRTVAGAWGSGVRQTQWTRLQNLAQRHALELFKGKAHSYCFRTMPKSGTRYQTRSESWVCEHPDHMETVRVLGSGDAGAVCARIHWYLTVYPSWAVEAARGTV